MLLFFRRILCPVVLCVLVFSCNKNNLNSSAPPGIALTFDDNYVDNWYKYIDVFDSLKVKATFYISNFNKLSQAQISKLRDLQNRGHEIAFHSTSHQNFVKYLDHHKCDYLISEEITKGIELMNREGFYPQTFAYPYGSHTDALDKILLKYFKSVRTLNGTRDLSGSLSPTSGNNILRGLGIDESSRRSIEQIEGLLSMASQKNTCAVLLVHNIERSDITMQIPLWKLTRIIEKAKSLNLKFYTVSEISK